MKQARDLGGRVTAFLSHRRPLIRPLCSLLLLAIVFGSAAQTFSAQQENTTANARKLVKRATRLARAESVDEAESLLRKALAESPASSEVKVELAFVLTKKRNLREAYDLVFPVAEAEPANGRAFSVLGTILLVGGRFKEARAIFYNAIRVDRRQHLAWAGCGLLDFYENRIADSLTNLTEAVYYAPNEPDHQLARAQVAARAEKYADAAEGYRQFLAVSAKTDRDRRERIESLIRFLTFLGQKPGLYGSAGAEQTEIPFELVANRPVLSVSVNGSKKPLRFVLDTGSGITVISNKTAKLLGISPITRGGFARGVGGDGRFEIVYGFLREIGVGEVALKNVPVYIREFHNSNQNIDGYLGLSLISKFLTTVDYGQKTFRLSRRDALPDEAAANAELSLPLRLTSSGFLSGEVQLEGIESPLNFIVDTGASVSVISERIAANDGIMPFAGSEKLQVIGSAGVADNIPTFMLPRVSFGSHSRTQVAAIALDLDLINEASGFEQSGILGGNFLKNYRMTFDFRNSKVIFTALDPVARQ